MRARLAEMPDEVVHCVVTSPPYWGLRDYKLEPQVWDSGEWCEHEWDDEQIRGGPSQINTGGNSARVGRANLKEQERRNDSLGQFCHHCSAWRGSLGLEPTPELFIKHLVSVFREVRRVLRKDGTCWLNLGDSYAGSGPSGASYQSETTKRRAEGDGTDGVFRVSKRLGERGLTYAEKKPVPPPGLKPKDLCGIPWRVALALQGDGWWLRSDIVWAKPNPMPESVRDRPTRSHEYLFLLTKSARYFFDQEAVREPHSGDWGGPRPNPAYVQHDGTVLTSAAGRGAETLHRGHPAGRNIRSVWTIATQPFPEAHFAVFPEKLVEPCIQAGTSERGCCAECGAPWERVVDVAYENPGNRTTNGPRSIERCGGKYGTMGFKQRLERRSTTTDWHPTCACGGDPVPCTVLDPFAGAGTALLVALRLGRQAIGIELSAEYVEMARKRIHADAPLLNQEAAAWR